MKFTSTMQEQSREPEHAIPHFSHGGRTGACPVTARVLWLNQMATRLTKLALVLLVCACGCNVDRDSASQTKSANSANALTDAPQSEHVPTEIEPGFYRDGADYERVSHALAKSDASIRLDYHSGIEWYDKSSKTWATLNDINDVNQLLASIKNKQLVTVSTGKAAWGKYDEYITKIAGFADDLGFDMTIVTDDNSQGLVISKVIQHRN